MKRAPGASDFLKLPKPQRVALQWAWIKAVMADASVSPSARLAAFVLFTHHSAADGRCFPSYETIAKEAGFRRRHTAIRAIKELEAAGWVSKEMRGRGKGGRSYSNQFDLNFDRLETVPKTAPLADLVNGTQNARNGTQNSTRTKTNSTPFRGGGVSSDDNASAADVRADARPPAEAEGFAEFKAAYPKQDGIDQAERPFRNLAMAGHATAAELIEAAGRYAAECEGREPKFIALARNYLLGERWKTQAAPTQASEPKRRPPTWRTASAAEAGKDL